MKLFTKFNIKMSKAFILLGVNEGKRLENIQEAVTRIEIRLVKDPLSLYTKLHLWVLTVQISLMHVLRSTLVKSSRFIDKLLDIERAMGREPQPKEAISQDLLI